MTLMPDQIEEMCPATGSFLDDNTKRGMRSYGMACPICGSWVDIAPHRQVGEYQIMWHSRSRPAVLADSPWIAAVE